MVYSKFKVCRRILDNPWQTKKLTQKQKNLIVRLRKTTNRKQSDYSIQLKQMKKLFLFYGIRHKSCIAKNNLRSSFLDKQKSFLLKLETRLDVILLRLNYCCTISTARQLISHRKICVNFNVVKSPSYQLRPGDIVSIAPDCLDYVKSIVKFNQQNKRFCSTNISHIEVNYKILHAILLYEPSKIHFPYKIDLDLIF